MSSDNAGTPTLLTNFIRNPNGTFNISNVSGDPLAMANGLNHSLTIVGASHNGAFKLAGANFTVVPPAVPGVTGSETAFGTNDGGLIAGQFTDNATDTTPGFLLNGSSFTILNRVANALVTNAQAINDNGLVTGFYSTDGVHQHGFFYNSTTGTFQYP